MNISNRIRKIINEDNKVEKKYLIENIIKRVSQKLITERKTDELSLYISRKIVNQFKKKEDFEVEGLYFQRGDEEASFDLICKFIEDEDGEGFMDANPGNNNAGLPKEGNWRAISEPGDQDAKMYIQKGSRMNDEEYEDE